MANPMISTPYHSNDTSLIHHLTEKVHKIDNYVQRVDVMHVFVTGLLDGWQKSRANCLCGCYISYDPSDPP